MRERDLGRGMYVEVWQRYVCRGIGRCIVPSIWQNYAWMQRYARERFTGDVEVCAREGLQQTRCYDTFLICTLCYKTPHR